MSRISSAADTVVLSGLYSVQDIVAMSWPRSASGTVAMLGECSAADTHFCPILNSSLEGRREGK